MLLFVVVGVGGGVVVADVVDVSVDVVVDVSVALLSMILLTLLSMFLLMLLLSQATAFSCIVVAMDSSKSGRRSRFSKK